MKCIGPRQQTPAAARLFDVREYFVLYMYVSYIWLWFFGATFENDSDPPKTGRRGEEEDCYYHSFPPSPHSLITTYYYVPEWPNNIIPISWYFGMYYSYIV